MNPLQVEVELSDDTRDWQVKEAQRDLRESGIDPVRWCRFYTGHSIPVSPIIPGNPGASCACRVRE